MIWFDTLASDQSLPSLNVLHSNFKQFGLRLKFETCLSEVLDRSRSTVRSVRLQNRSANMLLYVVYDYKTDLERASCKYPALQCKYDDDE